MAGRGCMSGKSNEQTSVDTLGGQLFRISLWSKRKSSLGVLSFLFHHKTLSLEPSRVRAMNDISTTYLPHPS